MKKLIFFIFISWSFQAGAQADSLPPLEPYFSAIIVKDIEQSIAWYVEKLGLQVVNKSEHEQFALRQANLQRGDIWVELIELGSALAPEKVIPNYNAKTKLQGLFKIGFRVNTFDQWVEYLQDKNVHFHGAVVKDKISGKRMIIILDPDGNRIQLFEK